MSRNRDCIISICITKFRTKMRNTDVLNNNIGGIHTKISSKETIMACSTRKSE